MTYRFFIILCLNQNYKAKYHLYFLIFRLFLFFWEYNTAQQFFQYSAVNYSEKKYIFLLFTVYDKMYHNLSNIIHVTRSGKNKTKIIFMLGTINWIPGVGCEKLLYNNVSRVQLTSLVQLQYILYHVANKVSSRQNNFVLIYQITFIIWFCLYPNCKNIRHRVVIIFYTFLQFVISL